VKNLIYSNPCPHAEHLTTELRAYAKFGPGVPENTPIFFEGKQVTSFGVEEETLSDGSKAYNIVLTGGSPQ